MGRLCDVIAGALAHRPTVLLDRSPRMSDYCRWGVSVERALGWPDGSFMNAYRANLAESREIAFESSPVAAAVNSLLGVGRVWRGSASTLYEELGSHVPDSIRKSKAWPRAPRGLVNALDRIAPILRSQGVEICRTKTKHNREILLKKESASGTVQGAQADDF